MPLELTPSQARALDLSTHLSVTANAGAGKTAVLARRFVEIFLRTDARLAEVVAITFTEQAAAELRRKIHDVIGGRLRSGGLSRDGRERLERLNDRLSSAMIGTIHSFCARILRSYPAEAGVDGAFTVLEGRERTRLVTESVAETFAGLMDADSGAEATDFRALLRAVPPRRLERILVRLFARREQLYLYFGRGREGRPGIVEAIVAKAAGSGWGEKARRTAAAAGGRDAARVLECVPADFPGADPVNAARAVADAGAIMFIGSGEFRKSFLGPVAPGSLPGTDAGDLKEFESSYGSVLRSLTAPGAPGMVAPGGSYEALAATLERTYRAAEERYRAKKDDLGALDFEDLQTKTLELLADPAARAGLQNDVRFLLVDEFQDTNDLQYGILHRLLDGLRKGNLFIVGDPKQSIYGFRNADVGVFAQAQREITGGSEGGGAAVVLAESFRPLPVVAAFVNAVFSRMMPGSYEPIVAARADAASGASTDPRQGAVEMIVVRPDPAGSPGAAVRAECRLAARRLKEIAAGGPGGRTGFGDCAILLRDRTNLPVLERILEEEGVPYLLAGGVGFFRTQEVYDFLNYLRFLLSPDDDPALAGVLRSPFFSLSDARIYDISLGPGGPLWERLRGAAASAGCPPEAVRACAILGRHLSLAGRIPVARLLRRIAADTGWFGVMAGLSRGSQHRENFLKLLGHARERGIGGPSSLYHFTAFLEHREEEREGQAATSAAGTAVRIMTIHAAKGLEFPVVMLPFLDRALRPDGEPIVHPLFGIGFRPGGRESPEPPELAFLKALSQEQRAEEEKRVLYVACTRARDRLVLSGVERTKAGRHTPLAWVLGAASAAGAVERDGAIDFGDQTVTCVDRSGESPVHRGRIVRLRVPVARPAAVISAPPGTPGAAAQTPAGTAEAPRILTLPLADAGGGEIHTATRLAAYDECPALYYLRYVLGIEEGPGPSRSADSARAGAGDRDEEDEFDAGLEGEIAHRILSEAKPGWESEDVRRAAERIWTDPEITRAASPARPSAQFSRGPETAQAARERILGNVIAFLRSPVAEILRRPEVRIEHQISAFLGTAIVVGKLDRLFRGADGTMEFVDYKTGAAGGASTSKRASVHAFQMATYAWLVARLHAQRTVRGSLVYLAARAEGPEVVVLEYGPAELAAIEKKIERAIDGIRRSKFEPLRHPCEHCPAPPSGLCPVRTPL